MLEAGVADEKIIQMLQKYWDLRLSEGKQFIERRQLSLSDELDK